MIKFYVVCGTRTTTANCWYFHLKLNGFIAFLPRSRQSRRILLLGVAQAGVDRWEILKDFAVFHSDIRLSVIVNRVFVLFQILKVT